MCLWKLPTMKKILILGVIVIHFVACNREDTRPGLLYLDNIIAGESTGAGIKYSGLINDTLLFDFPSSSTSRIIDVNDDDIGDFKLSFSGTASPGHANSRNSIVALENSAIAIKDIENLITDTISRYDTIDNNLNWICDTCIIYNYYWDVSGNSSETGLWNNVKDKFIGIRIIIDDNTLYGWIRIELNNGWNLTLIDYASTIGYEN